jgi:hypothetical protein
MARIQHCIINTDGGLALGTVLGLLQQLGLVAFKSDTVVILALDNLTHCFFGSVGRPG